VNLKDSKGNGIANIDLAVANGGKAVALVDYDADVLLNGTDTLQ
jgi:hypothetical protein